MSIKLAGCIITDSQERVLLLHRNTRELIQWEIPGGKIEDGEMPEAAAMREAGEELGVDIEIARKLGEKEFEQSSRHWHYSWYLGRIATGSVTIMETEMFDDFRYFSTEDMRSNFDLLSPNVQNFLGMVESNQIILEKV